MHGRFLISFTGVKKENPPDFDLTGFLLCERHLPTGRSQNTVPLTGNQGCTKPDSIYAPPGGCGFPGNGLVVDLAERATSWSIYVVSAVFSAAKKSGAAGIRTLQSVLPLHECSAMPPTALQQVLADDLSLDSPSYVRSTLHVTGMLLRSLQLGQRVAMAGAVGCG